MNRVVPLTPWGKAVKIEMIKRDITPKQLVQTLREHGCTVSEPKLSAMLNGRLGQRSSDVVACIDRLLSIPPNVEGRPA